MVAIAPDGKTALSSGEDFTVTLWDLSSGEKLRALSGHTHFVEDAAFSPDSRTLLSGSYDSTLKLWNVASGKELRTLFGHDGPVLNVSLASDGRSAISSSFDMTLRVWDFARGTAQRALSRALPRLRPGCSRRPATLPRSETLGEWYAFQGLDQWAVEFLGRARENGAAVAPLTLARCYWNLNRMTDALREFQIAMGQSKDPADADLSRLVHREHRRRIGTKNGRAAPSGSTRGHSTGNDRSGRAHDNQTTSEPLNPAHC